MTRDERLEEALFTGLRLNRGIDIERRRRPLRRATSGSDTARRCSRFSTRDGSSARGRGSV